MDSTDTTTGAANFSDAAWFDVIEAMEDTYKELVNYQEQLEAKNVELNELHVFMSSVFSSVSDIVLVVDKTHKIERSGGALMRVLGARNSAEPGAQLVELVTTADRVRLTQFLDDVILNSSNITAEFDFKTETSCTPIDLSIGPRLDERARSKGAVLIGRPIGELRQANAGLAASVSALTEAQSLLIRNEKLASLGRLVAGVAHELNNPISFVYANTHALEKYAQRFESYFKAVQDGASRKALVAMRRDLKLDETIRNLRIAIDGAKEGAERVRDIVEDLRRLSANGNDEAVEFDLVTTARTASDWVSRGTKSAVEITVDPGNNPRAMGNPGHVQQIVMNLIQNALDAVTDVDGPSVKLLMYSEDGEAVLYVCDNGSGIAQDAIDHIFDPFFTTKSVGEGTGLGLSISHKMAEEHGGSLRLVSHDPGHTCFELRLPQELSA